MMPGRDGRGPVGKGMLSGRGLGSCAGVNRGVYGFGCRRGFDNRPFGGFGGFWANSGRTEKDEKEILKEQRDFLRARLEDIDKQLEER